MSIRFLRISGRFRASALALPALAMLTACNYGFLGGGGFPADIRSLFIASFENQTAEFELDQQVFRKLQERVPRALGVRPAGRDMADAVLTGSIVRYEDVAQNYRPGAPGDRQTTEVIAHQVQIIISARIVDTKRHVILWESASISGQGEWLRDTETVERGRERAIDEIVQKIIDGAQSQW